MTKREEVLAVVRGERVEVVPTIAEAFMDVTVARALGVEPTGDWVSDEIRLAELLRRNDAGVGAGVGATDLERAEDHRLYEYETGARWLEKYRPNFSREAVRYPVAEPVDLESLRFPDGSDPARYTGVAEAVRTFHEQGYFVQGGTGGFWSGSYYFCTSFDTILTWMGAEPEAAETLFGKVGEFVMACAEQLLDRGVDSIFFYDDLGTGTSLIFSPSMYRRFIKPWHRRLAELCHGRGKLLHMHCHGHIQELMEDIVDAGVDILNPVGPSDRNDLAMFVERWGDRITLLGGISTTIAEMTEAEISAHVDAVMAAGTRTPRFMPRTESGVPRMPPAKARYFLDTLLEARRRHGSGRPGREGDG
jgi:uroporphyrinogen-III decarboxylase